MIRRIVMLIVGVAGILAAPVAADGARTLYRGQWFCDDRGALQPLGGMEIQLWRRGSPDFLPVELVGSVDQVTFTNPDGTFELTARDSEDNQFMRIALRDSAGVHLKDFWGINDWSIDVGVGRNNVATREVGAFTLSTPGQSHKCAIWRGVHLAHQDLRTITGSGPAGGGVLINADAATAGVPFTPHTAIWWPGGFPVGYGGPGDDSITRHEFGHVIRHGFDGDFGHFLGDVATHNYLQNHEACNRTGPGFAFNEGWAEYWARDYAPAPSCPGRDPADTSVEGNVAAALADLEARCFSGNRAPMVAVLRDNPGVIHSFEDFRARVACPAPLVLTPLPPTPAVALQVSAEQRAAIAAAQVRAVDRRIARLRVQLRRASRLAVNELPCGRTPCNAALRRSMQPSLLGAELAVARLVRNAIDDFDTAAEQQTLGALDATTASGRNDTAVQNLRVRSSKAMADGIQAALRAGAGVFARDRSTPTRRLRTRLLGRLSAFRRAQRGTGPLPRAFLLDEALVDRATRTARQTITNPEPTPDLRKLSALTLTCPASGKPGVFVINGTLVAPAAGIPIELRATSPGGTTTTSNLTTDAQGAFASGVAMQQVGTWTIEVLFAGDAATRPAQKTCQIPIA